MPRPANSRHGAAASSDSSQIIFDDHVTIAGKRIWVPPAPVRLGKEEEEKIKEAVAHVLAERRRREKAG